MSGHSKWLTIKRKKGAADTKRGAVWAFESCLNLSPTHSGTKYNIKLEISR